MKITVVAALLSAFVTTTALAADTGFYLGAKFGSVNYDFSYASNNSQAGYGLLGGYFVSDYFAVEAEFNRLGGFDDNFYGSTITGKSFGFSGVGLLPLNREFSLFGKMGIVSSSLEDSPQPGFTGPNRTGNYTGLSIGLGGQFNVGEAAGIRFGLDGYPVSHKDFSNTSNLSSASMLYIGGIVRF